MKPEYDNGFYLVKSLRGSHTGVHAARQIVGYHSEEIGTEQFASLAGFTADDFSKYNHSKFYEELEASYQFNDCVDRMVAEGEKIGLAVFDSTKNGICNPAIFIVLKQ
jgi:hypothetical protein